MLGAYSWRGIATMILSLNLKPCPAPDEGVHKWVYYAACTLVEAGYSDEDAIDIIEE